MLISGISGNWRGSVIEDEGMSRLRLFLGLMFDLEIPEISFSSASSGFSEQNQEKDEDC